nr:uncharacterized protein LOC129152431 [Nothobranchius furzeri]
MNLSFPQKLSFSFKRQIKSVLNDLASVSAPLMRIIESVCVQSDSQLPAGAKPGADTTGGLQSAEGSNGNMGGPDTPGEEESSSNRKVVRVMRRGVRSVAAAGTEEQNQSTLSTSASEPGISKPRAAGEDKDALSMGLTSLMGRGRTKEHRPRTRTQDRKEEVKPEEEKEKVEEEEEEEEEGKCTIETSPLPAPPAPNPELPKSNLLIPPAGFIPPSKPNPLAPPAGFIPAPKQNPLTPPPGFIPAKKPSPMPPKQNPLARPPGFIPVPKTDQLAPPAGFIPKARSFTVKKAEVRSEKVHVSLSGACPKKLTPVIPYLL